MSNQGNYKRTVAGSVGAGMGAIFNASGRTYYILEHKTQSKYHNIGESQKIIIDQVELGRDASCQVRFDQDTVSRKHAAIVRNGNNWELIHLSTTNPTLVNGRPIEGSYYLQSGDEIQLSVGGPRMGFIQPQGKQGLTSSIRLTERMNLFRQQALAPYKKAIWTLAILLLLTILGFGAWNLYLHKQNSELREQQQAAIETISSLDGQIGDLEAQIAAAEKSAADAQAAANRRSGGTVIYRGGGGNSAELANLRRQLDELKAQRQSAVAHLDQINIELGEEPASIVPPVIKDPNVTPGQNPENKEDSRYTHYKN